MKKIFILVPSMRPTGPVKGAIALANALATQRSVSLVSLKPGPGSDAKVHQAVRQVCLADAGGGRFPWRVGEYRKMLRHAGGRQGVASISLCLSADMVNLACRGVAVTCASVRGNLPQNYRLDYGVPGWLLARWHLACLRGMDRVAVMSESMAAQVSGYCGCEPQVIGNFVDEPALDVWRCASAATGPWRFVFLASLTQRKRPELLLSALMELIAAGDDVRLDIMGDGPLLADMRMRIEALRLHGRVTLHGQTANPYPLLAQADALVLPSLSEGISRAGLEALHLGVPCVLRAVDGNAELVQNGENGVLFDGDVGLAGAMRKAARLSREREGRASLLPPAFRQVWAAQRYLKLVETV